MKRLSPKYVFRIDMSKFKYRLKNEMLLVRNPLGYKRVLKNSMREDAARYFAFKQFVRAEFYTFTNEVNQDGRGGYAHPIVLGDYFRMDILIGFVSEHHADPDNVWKGICDALIAQDKHVAGSFDFTHTKERHGWIDVNIWVEANTTGSSSLERLPHTPP